MQPVEMLMLSLTLFTAAALPSLSTLLVTTNTLAAGVRSGVVSAMGVVAGDVIWLLLALTGLTAVYPLIENYGSVLKVMAALFLIVLALKLGWQKQDRAGRQQRMTQAGQWSGFMAGLILTLADFKAILFYLAVLPAFIELSNLSLSDILVMLLITVMSVGMSKLAYVAVTLRLGEKLPASGVKFLRYFSALLLFVIAGCLLLKH